MAENHTEKLCSHCGKTLWVENKLHWEGRPLCSSCYDVLTSETIKEVKSNKEILTPSYYWKGGMDLITYAKMKFPKEEVKGFLRINALKYLIRYEEKGGVDDLDKSMNYTRMLKELEEETNGKV